ncbi:Mucin-2 [Xylographa pallens]|nr:Mucin-2 [Xylographa pallens]
MGRHPPLHHHHHHHHHRSSSTTAPPTAQTLRRIRALSDGDDHDHDHDCAKDADCKRGNRRWDWDWEWESWAFADAQTVVRGGSIELGAGLERIGGWIPGLKGTAAFLSTLRQNLALTTSLLPPDSPATPATSMSSPPSLHSSTTLPPPPSPPSASAVTPPSSSSTSSTTPTPLSTTPVSDDLPPLTTLPATTAAHKHAALHLLASALAQRRQLACALVIRSPPFLAALALALGILLQATYTGRASLPLIGTTFAGIVMALLIAVRWLAGGYLDLAERVDWAWLGEDEVWVSLWGVEEVVVGAVVVRTERERGGKRRRRGVVRGWTVRLRERGRGVGRGLLEAVGRMGRERGWEGVEFEEGGVFDERVLPKMFHGEFVRRAARGRALLEEVWVEQGGRKRSR